MLIRFVVKNLFSFDEETELNVFPNKSQRLPHHKIKVNDIEALRITAIYGANGSGKSNLIKALSLLEKMIGDGNIHANLTELTFKLNKENYHLPISFGIEFYYKTKIYYYTLTCQNDTILYEALYESNPTIDKVVFERNIENEKQQILFFEGYVHNEENRLFVKILSEKLLQKNELLISFLHNKYKVEFPDVSNAFDWFDNVLVVIKPDSKPMPLAHFLDKNQSFKAFSDDFIASLQTGISKISVKKEKLTDFMLDSDRHIINKIIEDIKTEPNKLAVIEQQETGDVITLTYEQGEIISKRLITSHLDNEGKEIDFYLGIESDGTKRLIDYLPAFQGIISQEKVYVIDEIERSIHPITIKKIISKISLDEEVKGQLIFTTHESCLLDQDILRPDEIWFAQKDITGSSKFYPLSDFNIHGTANIQNGYLNGRYGGIPFLSNLTDLNWHKYEQVFE